MDRYRSGMEIPEEAEPYPKPTPRAKLLGELTAPRICYDVTFYDLNIEIDLDNRKIAGFVNFHAWVVNDFTELQFDLAKNMVLDDVNYKGKTLAYVREEDAVFVIFPAMAAGTQFQFRVTYHGEPAEAKQPPWDGGFVWEKDKADRDFVAVACEGDGASLWWPCKDHPTEEPDSMAINITVPSDIMCVANGRLREKVETDVKTTYKWFVTKPINNYNVSVNIANYAVIVDTIHSVTGIQPATYYVLDYNEAVAREHFKEARDMMRSLEKFFGPFPWWEDGINLWKLPTWVWNTRLRWLTAMISRPTSMVSALSMDIWTISSCMKQPMSGGVIISQLAMGQTFGCMKVLPCMLKYYMLKINWVTP